MTTNAIETSYKVLAVTAVPAADTFPYYSDVLILPASLVDFSVAVNEVAGSTTSVEVQYTISSYDDIIAGTATWFNWTTGAVTNSTAPLEELYSQVSINGLRLNISAGVAGTSSVTWAVLGYKEYGTPIAPVWLSRLPTTTQLTNTANWQISGGSGVINGKPAGM